MSPDKCIATRTLHSINAPPWTDDIVDKRKGRGLTWRADLPERLTTYHGMTETPDGKGLGKHQTYPVMQLPTSDLSLRRVAFACDVCATNRRKHISDKVF